MRRLLTCLLSALSAVCAFIAVAPPAAAIAAPTVRITPNVATVVAGATRQLSAAVTNLSDPSVVWTIRSGSGTGSVSSSGLYTAPSASPPNGPAVVRATSVQDGTVFGEATVAVTSGVSGGGFGSDLSITGGSTDVATGDVNGDGVADIVRLQGLANGVQVWQLTTMISDGNGGFTTTTSPVGSVYPTGVANIKLSLGDVDTDGDLDAVIAIEDISPSATTDRYQIYRNDGTGTWTADSVVKANTGREGATGVALVDWDGDGHLDLVRLDRLGTIGWMRGDGAGAFAAETVLTSVTDAHYLAAGDLTGDGRPDLAIGTVTGFGAIEQSFTVVTNDGFGGVAASAPYTAGLNPRPIIADVDGDGWNDVVTAAGQWSSPYPANILGFHNLGTGAGTLSTTPDTLVGNIDAWNLRAVDANGDGSLDLAGLTQYGPFLARQTGPTFSLVHAAAANISVAAFADVTGDGRLDVLASSDPASLDNSSHFWPGSSDTSLHMAIDPTVTRVDATLSRDFSVTVRNAPVPAIVYWSASRGAFATGNNTYTAPSAAEPTGSTATVTASLYNTTSTASRQITIVNEQFELTSLGSRNVRAVLADPADTNTVYVATDAGVYRSTTGGASFSLLGTTTTTGTDARSLALARDNGAGVSALVALFGTTPYRYDLVGGGDWAAGGGGSFTTATSVAAVPGTQVVYAASGGAVWRSTDAAVSWTSLGGTSVTRVAPIDSTTFWAVRSTAPRVETGAVSGGTATFTDRSTPYPSAAVNGFATDPSAPATAYAAIAETNGVRMVRGNATTGAWTSLTPPAVTDQIAVSPTGDVLTAGAGSGNLLKSVDSGASWYSVARGFAGGVTMASVGWRADGLALVGTSSGVYTPVEPTPPATPTITDGPTGTTGPGTKNSFTFTFTSAGTSSVCALDDTGWQPCSGSASYGPLDSGSHTFSVEAVDDHGNASAPATQTWTVDATPPAAPSGLDGPSGLVNSASAQFTFTLPGDAAGATCSLDNATPSSCSSPQSYNSLAEGGHTFEVRAVDAYGNASSAVTRSWTVDTQAPAFPYFFQQPNYVTSSTAASFTWTTDPDATYSCLLDTVSVSCSAAGYSVSNLAEGSHTFDVTASDLAGNQATDEATWTVDLTSPHAPTITAHPAASTNATTADFSFASDSSDVASYTCTLDNNSLPCWQSASYSDLGTGQHTFDVVASDLAGNTSSAASWSWTIDATAPTVTITTPAASLQPVWHATFSEPVTGVDATTVRLHVTGSSSNLAASIVCRDASAVTTPCSGASVRVAVLTPTALLVPGQHYTFDVSGVTDVAGNPVTPANAAMTAPGTVQETSGAVRPSWRKVSLSSARGGSYTVAHRKGASASYAFTGPSVTWYAVTGPSFGTADVSIDGVAKGKVNLYAVSAGVKSLSWSSLGAGQHTLRIVVRSEKGSRHGTGTSVSVDAFKVGATVTSSPAVAYTWQRVAASAARGDGYAVDDLAGASFTLTFRGTSLGWTTVTGPGMGKAQVKIDGVSKGTWDQWAKSLHYGVTRSFTGLSKGVHTVTITVLGKHRSGATGNSVAVDQLVASG